jgi:hypothetical protein
MAGILGRVRVLFQGEPDQVPYDQEEGRERHFLGLVELKDFVDLDYSIFYHEYIYKHIVARGSVEELFDDFIRGECIKPWGFQKMYRKAANTVWTKKQALSYGIWTAAAWTQTIAYTPLVLASAFSIMATLPGWFLLSMYDSVSALAVETTSAYKTQMTQGWQTHMEPLLTLPEEQDSSTKGLLASFFCGFMTGFNFVRVFNNALLASLSVPLKLVVESSQRFATTLHDYHIQFMRWRVPDIALITAIAGARPILWREAPSAGALVLLYDPSKNERIRILQVHAVPCVVERMREPYTSIEAAAHTLAQEIRTVEIVTNQVPSVKESILQALETFVDEGADRVPLSTLEEIRNTDEPPAPAPRVPVPTQEGGAPTTFLAQALESIKSWDPLYLESNPLQAAVALRTGYWVEELPFEMVAALVPQDPTSLPDYEGPRLTESNMVMKQLSPSDANTRASWILDSNGALTLSIPTDPLLQAQSKKALFTVMVPVDDNSSSSTL